MMRRETALFGALLLASACAGELPRAENGAPIASLVVRAVEWNVNKVPLTAVRGVADDGPVVVVLSDHAASVFLAGALVATDVAHEGWTSAGVLPGADGTPRWILGVDGKGRVEYLRNGAAFEDVSPRYGLDGVPVRALAALGGKSVVLQLDRELAVADGRHVTRFKAGPFAQVVAGAGLAVGVNAGGLQVFRTNDRSVSSYPLPQVTSAAVGPDGRVYAATTTGIYANDAAAGLSLVFRDPAAGIHGLVASGNRVWFADGRELGVVDGDRVALTHGAHLGSDARLAPSASGDVWVIDDVGVTRYQPSVATPSEQARWSTIIAPAFARSCAACHLPGGRAGLDLSVPAAWETNRAAILQRVVVAKTMPPDGRPMLESDRAAVKAWGDTGAGSH